jgi:hypothetical protein
MLVNTLEQNGQRSKLEFIIEGKTFENIITKTTNTLNANVSIPGFRKGKVPVAILETKYKDYIQENAKEEALKSVNLYIKDTLKKVIDSVIKLDTNIEYSDKKITIECEIDFAPEVPEINFEEFQTTDYVEDKQDLEVDFSSFDVKYSNSVYENIHLTMESFAKNKESNSDAKYIEDVTLEKGDRVHVSVSSSFKSKEDREIDYIGYSCVFYIEEGASFVSKINLDEASIEIASKYNLKEEVKTEKHFDELVFNGHTYKDVTVVFETKVSKVEKLKEFKELNDEEKVPAASEVKHIISEQFNSIKKQYIQNLVLKSMSKKFNLPVVQSKIDNLKNMLKSESLNVTDIDEYTKYISDSVYLINRATQDDKITVTENDIQQKFYNLLMSGAIKPEMLSSYKNLNSILVEQVQREKREALFFSKIQFDKIETINLIGLYELYYKLSTH